LYDRGHSLDHDVTMVYTALCPGLSGRHPCLTFQPGVLQYKVNSTYVSLAGELPDPLDSVVHP